MSLHFHIKDINATESAWSADLVMGLIQTLMLEELIAKGKKGMFVNWLMVIQTLIIKSSTAM